MYTAGSCFFVCTSLTADKSLNVLGYQSYLLCNVAMLSVVSKDLPISPRFSPYDVLSRFKFSTLTTLVNRR